MAKHLVIDARCVLPLVDGLHTYLRNLAPHICAAGREQRDFRTTLLVHPDMASCWHREAPDATVIPSTVSLMRPAQNWQVPRAVAPLRPDLFFYPAHDPPLFLRAPFVCTVHDVTLFRMRRYFERLDGLKRTYLRVVTPVGLRRAQAIFAVSEATRREIGALFGRDLLPKIHVTPNAVSPLHGGAVAPAVARDRLLYVGNDRPHKNLHRLVQGYALARREVPDLPPLELVGVLRTPDELRKTIRESGVADHVALRGHLSTAELEAAYAHALALVFPSVAEGFGIPILEAMVRGLPVITSSVSACVEVAADAAATVDPFDVRAIADAIVRVSRDGGYRADLVRRGYARASEFSWERTAAQTVAVIRACLFRGR